ncbi:hypothetical protein MTP03_15480 [Tsukamurella sp. PLM1]|nr:hypothetical protein MTP03_15480 [Tsukamurella sp. PLM1]
MSIEAVDAAGAAGTGQEPDPLARTIAETFARYADRPAFAEREGGPSARTGRRRTRRCGSA